MRAEKKLKRGVQRSQSLASIHSLCLVSHYFCVLFSAHSRPESVTTTQYSVSYGIQEPDHTPRDDGPDGPFFFPACASWSFRLVLQTLGGLPSFKLALWLLRRPGLLVSLLFSIIPAKSWLLLYSGRSLHCRAPFYHPAAALLHLWLFYPLLPSVRVTARSAALSLPVLFPILRLPFVVN